MAYILNGELIEQDTILLPVNQNGAFWHGDGFFETMRYMNGRIIFIEQHWERLANSCLILQMRNPFKQMDDISHYVDILAKKHPNRSFRLKLNLWRHGSTGYKLEDDNVEFLLSADFMDTNDYPLNDRGLALTIYTENLKSISKLSNVKSTSSQLYVLATQFTQSQNMDDCLLLNAKKHPIETSRSNFWLVMDETIYTPPLNEGCLDGIMRGVLLEICNEYQIPVQQENITLEMLESAEEAFTSNAIRGVQWISSINNKSFTINYCSRKLSELLNHKALNIY